MCCGTSQISPCELVFLQHTTAPTEPMVTSPLVKAEFMPSVGSQLVPQLCLLPFLIKDRQFLTIEREILQIKQNEEASGFPS